MNPFEGVLNTELAGATVDLVIHFGQGGLQPLLELPSGQVIGSFTVPRVVESEDGIGHRPDLLIDLPNPVDELGFIRPQFGRPTVEPVVDDLARHSELIPGLRVDAGHVTPDDFGFVEHRGFDLRVCPGPGQAFAQRLKGVPFQDVGADRFGPKEQDRQGHDGEAQ